MPAGKPTWVPTSLPRPLPPLLLLLLLLPQPLQLLVLSFLYANLRELPAPPGLACRIRLGSRSRRYEPSLVGRMPVRRLLLLPPPSPLLPVLLLAPPCRLCT